MSTYSYYCARCGEGVDVYDSSAAWNLDGSETVIHTDMSRCEYYIRTNPDVIVPNVTLRLVPKEPEHRSTGALDPERGLWHGAR